ncbi:hypothetical protein N7467_005763 [Penicillium canescens]|nr:hypothetical protein N7467_005763 [Penicillium canescens]
MSAKDQMEPFALAENSLVLPQDSRTVAEPSALNDRSGPVQSALVQSALIDHSTLIHQPDPVQGPVVETLEGFAVPPLPTLPPPTQADNLPPYVWTLIPNIRKLSKKWDQDLWLCRVKGTLHTLGIKDVISKYLDRPDESHPSYQNWKRWSQRVDRWLFTNVGEKIRFRLQQINPPLEFADVTMEHILRLEPNEDDRMSIEVFNMWNMRRHDYDSAAEYVEAWSDQVQHCRRLDIGIGYYVATKVMLDELDEEYPVITTFVNREIREQDQTAHVMDWVNFSTIVNGMMGCILAKENPCRTPLE